MRREKMTLLQYGLLAFAFLYGGTLLSPGAYSAGEGAALAALLGCLLGTAWLFFLGRLGEAEAGGGKRSALYRICLLALMLVLLLLNLADFGTFYSREVMPALSPAICAMTLFALSLYAVMHGASTIGRFGEVSLFVLIPLLLILFPGLFPLDTSRLIPASIGEAALPAAKSAVGVLLSAFGDCLALSILAPDVISSRSVSATVYARASENAAREAFPGLARLRPRKHALTASLLLGGGIAALLFLLTVLGNLNRLDASLLAAAPYPAATASRLLHREVLSPFFLLCLTLLYAVKAMVLLLATCRLLASFLPEARSHTAPVPITLLAFFFFILLAASPDLADSARKSGYLLAFLVIFEFFLPVIRRISLFLQKRFDKSEKT